MDKTTWLMYGCMAVWLGLGLYVFILGRRQASLEKRLRQALLLHKKTDPRF